MTSTRLVSSTWHQYWRNSRQKLQRVDKTTNRASIRKMITLRLREGDAVLRNTMLNLKCGKVESNAEALTNCVYLSDGDFARAFPSAEGTWLRVGDQVFVAK